MEEINNQILDYLANLRKKELGEYSFDDIFQIEGISLLWLYYRFFLVHVFPKQLKICFKAFDKSTKITLYEEISSTIKSTLIRNSIYLSDKFKKASFKPKKIKQADILFISFLKQITLNKSGLNVYRINNMITKLKKDRKLSYNILVVPELSSFTISNRRSSTSFDVIYQHVTEKEINLARKKSAEIYKKWQHLDKNSIPRWRFMKYAFTLYFSKKFLYITALYIYTLKKIFTESKVKVVVLTARTSLFERAALALSKEIGYDVVYFPHGITPPYNKIYPYHLATNLDNKKTVLNQGYPKNKVKEVGPIIFDDIIKYKKIPINNNLILLTTAPLIEDNLMPKQEYFTKIKKLLSAINKKYSIVIKLHPREKTKKDYKRIINELGMTNTKVITGFDKGTLYTYIAKSKAVIHFHSTVALEAILLNRIVIDYEMFDKNPIIDLTVGSGACIYIKSPNELSNILNNLNNPKLKSKLNKNRNKFLNKLSFKLDGKAYERGVNFIYQLVRKNKGN